MSWNDIHSRRSAPPASNFNLPINRSNPTSRSRRKKQKLTLELDEVETRPIVRSRGNRTPSSDTMDDDLDQEVENELQTYENFITALCQAFQGMQFALRSSLFPIFRVVHSLVLLVTICATRFLELLRRLFIKILPVVITLSPVIYVLSLTNRIASTLTYDGHIPVAWCQTPLIGNLCPIATIPRETNEAHDEIADILRSMNHLVPLGYRICVVKRELRGLVRFVRFKTEGLPYNTLFVTLTKYGIGEYLSELRSLGKELEHNNLATACLHFEIHMKTMERSIMSFSEKVNDLGKVIKAYKSTATVLAYWREQGWTAAEVLEDLKSRILPADGDSGLVLWNEGYDDPIERPLDFSREILEGYFFVTQSSYGLRAAYKRHFDLLSSWIRLMMASADNLLQYNMPKQETLQPTMELFELAQDIRHALLVKAIDKYIWNRYIYRVSGSLPYDVKIALDDLNRIRPVSYEPLEIQSQLNNITTRFESLKKVLSRIQSRLSQWTDPQDPVVGSNANHLAQLHEELREIQGDLRRRIALSPQKAGDDGLERWRLIEAGRSHSQ